MRRFLAAFAAAVFLAGSAGSQTIKVREDDGGASCVGGSCASLATGLTHVYALEEDTTANREDTLNPGAGNAWSPHSSTSNAAGKHGNAVSIDPTHYLAITNTVLYPPTSTYTVSFWIKPTSFVQTPLSTPAGAPVFVSTTTSAGVDVWQIYGTTNVGVYNYPSGTTTLSGDPLSTGSWHLVVIWFDSGTGIGGIQIDGGVSSTYSSGTFSRSGGSTLIAFNDPTANLTALYDELYVWGGRVLSAAERTALCNPSGGVCAGTFYPFS